MDTDTASSIQACSTLAGAGTRERSARLTAPHTHNCRKLGDQGPPACLNMLLPLARRTCTHRRWWTQTQPAASTPAASRPPGPAQGSAAPGRWPPRPAAAPPWRPARAHSPADLLARLARPPRLRWLLLPAPTAGREAPSNSEGL